MNLLQLLVAVEALHIYEYHLIKVEWMKTARDVANASGKPLINIGCRWTCPQTCFTGPGDVNIDRDPCPYFHPNFYCADAHDLSEFGDKSFGCLFASHVLEHLDDPDKAVTEWRRVADRVIILVPSPLNLGGWAHPEHKWQFLENSLSPNFNPKNRLPSFFG